MKGLKLLVDFKHQNQDLKGMHYAFNLSNKFTQFFLKTLHREKVNYLYHCTSVGNLEEIVRQGGLYSWEYLEEHEIEVAYFGGNALSRRLDLRRGLQNYVRLSFCRVHPMAYRLRKEGQRVCILKIDPSIVNEQTLFSDENATASKARIGNGREGLNLVDFQAVNTQGYVDPEDEVFHLRQAEVMIEEKVPLKAILNIEAPVMFRG